MARAYDNEQHPAIGARCDTFGDAAGEKKARLFEVYGYPFMARKPG